MNNASKKDEPSGNGPQRSVDHPTTMTWTIPIEITVSMPKVPVQVKVTSGKASIAGAEGRFSSLPPDSGFGKFEIGSLSPNQFSWHTAFSMALASKLAYESETTVSEVTVNEWGFSDCRFIDVDDTQCFVVESDKFVVLCFRGSENLGDWIANLNMRSTTRGYGKVHRGFLGAFEAVKLELQGLLRNLQGRPLLLAGHSLGGALATVAAAEWEGKFPISGIYTFGQPGVGKGEFPKFINQNYDGKFYRFVNDDDIVTRVPPTYRHVGKLFHFDSWGNLKNSSSSVSESANGAKEASETDMFSEVEFNLLRSELHVKNAIAEGANVELPSASLAEGLLPSISDHRMDKYIEKIKRMV